MNFGSQNQMIMTRDDRSDRFSATDDFELSIITLEFSKCYLSLIARF
jgi:hypothetical protein